MSLSPDTILEIIEPQSVLAPSPNRQLYENSPLAGSSIESEAGKNPDRLFNQKDPNLAILHEKPEHRIMIMRKARGESNRDIASAMGYREAWVSQVMRQPWAREALLDEIRRNGGDEVSELLRGESVNSVFTIIDLRDNAEDESVRKACAQDLLDRHLGKATQRVESKNVGINLSVTTDAAKIDAELARLKDEEKMLTGAPLL